MHPGPLTAPLVALATLGTGIVTAAVGWTIAAGGTDLAPYVQGGAISILATAVGYVLKQFADSKIVTFPVAEIIRKAEEREVKLQQLVEDQRKLIVQSGEREIEGKDREDSLKALLIQRGHKP